MNRVGRVVMVGLAALALLVGATGCGDGDSTSDGDAIVVDAAAEVKAAGERTASVEWLRSRTVTALPTGEVVLEVEGTPDASVQIGTSSAPGMVLGLRSVDGVAYFDVSEFPSAALEPGKEWIALDKSAMPLTASGSTADQLALLSDASEEVEPLGDEVVNDVESTGYRLTVRTRDYLEAYGLDEMMDQTFEGMGQDPEELYADLGVDGGVGFFEEMFGPTLPMDVWVGDGLITRLVLDIEVREGAFADVPELAEMGDQFATSSTFDLLGTGEPQVVEAPDPAVQHASSYQEYIALLSSGLDEASAPAGE